MARHVTIITRDRGLPTVPAFPHEIISDWDEPLPDGTRVGYVPGEPLQLASFEPRSRLRIDVKDVESLADDALLKAVDVGLSMQIDLVICLRLDE